MFFCPQKRRRRQSRRPITMLAPWQASADGVQDTRRALFHCATPFLERQEEDPVHGLPHLQKCLAASFSARLDGRDLNSLDPLATARTLLFTEDEKEMMAQIVGLLGASDEELRWFSANVEQANHFVKVLVGGNRSPYPDVDGPSCSDADGEYTRLLRDIVSRIAAGSPETAMLDRFSAVAEIHYHNDQGRLAHNLARQTRENAAALEYARNIDFSQYAYGAVVVLGHSPTRQEAKEGKACSRMTKDKIARCVGLNHERGLAPFYIVCGGSVRPQLTRINEALSMKKELMDNYGIAGREILVDATSEHTYSNFMNAVLLAREANMPAGTKLAVYMVPDRYGNEDQHAFCTTKMANRASDEVYPEFESYFSMMDGNEDRSMDILLKDGQEKFLSPILLWKDYTGELRSDHGIKNFQRSQ
ncbi:hypothetical protein C8J57DRAFT_1331977 [Mycena rebaudengoi]|nr:hypothetical protein C8J57DRAFT_1331977 [Mycena rebaudengoi]